MAKAIAQLRSGPVVGHVGLTSLRAADPIAKDVHEGATLPWLPMATSACGSSVWTPEVSSQLPGTELPFVALDDPRWGQALADAGAQPLGPSVSPPGFPGGAACGRARPTPPPTRTSRRTGEGCSHAGTEDASDVPFHA